MLEYDFNELDDDFVTIWSNYLLYQNIEESKKAIEALAELGQINAIQNWFCLKHTNQVNEKINANTAKLSGHTFNEAHAIANGIYDQDRNNITTLKTQYINLENSELDLASRLTESKKKAYAFFKDEVIEEYKKTEFAKQIQQAAVLTECAAEQSYSALIYEKLMELYLQEPLIFGFEKMDDTNQAIRLDLRKRLKQNPNDISSKFALGKNLLYFGTKNKHINEAVNILSSLAARPLKTISTAKDAQEPSTHANSK